jgi:polar amino acid transport system substrate-binding protein
LSEDATIREAREALAPTGTLRVAINLANFLLVSGRDSGGTPYGVAPELAANIAATLGVAVHYVCFDMPDELARAVDDDVWNIALIGAEPARAKSIAFSRPYAEIECTYLVPAGSPFETIEEVDGDGVRIASAKGAAYDLWLERNLKRATLVGAPGLDESFEIFVTQKLDALAGLRPRLLDDVPKISGARILDGQFASVQQAIGTQRDKTIGARFLDDFVERAKQSGLVARLIQKHAVRGLSVAK